jgi:hypothetical protein
MLPLPAMRGEGWGEGPLATAEVMQWSPKVPLTRQPRLRAVADLSPQAGRGDCFPVFVDDAGHALTAERPEAFTEVVSDFLAVARPEQISLTDEQARIGQAVDNESHRLRMKERPFLPQSGRKL